MNRGDLERKLGVSTLLTTVDSTLTLLQALGAAGGSWLDLAIRFWLAKAFLIGCGKKSPTRRQEASSNEADSFDGVHDVRMLSFYGCGGRSRRR